MEIQDIQSFSLKEVFGKEDEGFTPWLVNNLDRLSKAIKIPMINARSEVTLESLRPDIIAYTATDGDEIIIENQYNKSDSYHIGKLLSYAAYEKRAKYAILITEKARDEHIEAVKALNEKKVCDCRFYIVNVRCYKIADSPYAISFDVIVEPELSEDEQKAISEKEQTLKQFWQSFIDKAKDLNIAMYARRKPTRDNWLNGFIGVSNVHFLSRVKKDGCSIALWFGSSDPSVNNDNFNTLLQYKDQIDKTFGEGLVWENDSERKMCKIEYYLEKVGGYENKDNWQEIIVAMLNKVKLLQDAVTPYIEYIN